MATFKIMRAELFIDKEKLKKALEQIPAGQDIVVAFEENDTADLSEALVEDIRDEESGFTLKSSLNGDIYYIANSVASDAGDDKGKHGGNSLDSEKGKPGGGNSLDNH